MWPVLSICASMKSSRLRHVFEPPASQMQPFCTGSLPVTSVVCHVVPPSYVVTTYRCQTPAKLLLWSSPAVDVPRKAHAAWPASPATAVGNWMFFAPTRAPRSLLGPHWPVVGL